MQALSTRNRNQCHLRDEAQGQTVETLTKPTPLQARALELVQSLPLGSPEAVLADNGHANRAEVEKVEADGVEAYVSTRAEGRRRLHDFRPPKDKQEKELKAD